MRKFAPPPTKFGPAAPGQAKTAPSQTTHIAPPPTKFGTVGTAQRRENPAQAAQQPASINARHKGQAILQTVRQSGFNSTKAYSGQIYGIYFNPQFASSGKITKNDLSMNQCLYVGKTIVKDVGDRFIQHTTEDFSKPWHIDNCSKGAYKSSNDDYWEYVPRQLWKLQSVTMFDVAAAEQYYLQEAIKAGANLRNRINALSREKYDEFKKNKDVFKTRKEYGTWKPKDLKDTFKQLYKYRKDNKFL